MDRDCASGRLADPCPSGALSAIPEGLKNSFVLRYGSEQDSLVLGRSLYWARELCYGMYSGTSTNLPLPLDAPSLHAPLRTRPLVVFESRRCYGIHSISKASIPSRSLVPGRGIPHTTSALPDESQQQEFLASFVNPTRKTGNGCRPAAAFRGLCVIGKPTTKPKEPIADVVTPYRAYLQVCPLHSGTLRWRQS